MTLFENWPAPDDRTRTRLTRNFADRILFVCTGNIARSASADLMAQQRFADLGLEYSSAGVGALVGHGVARDVAPALERRGIDVRAHTGRQFTEAIGRDAGLILALDHTHRRWILDEWPDLVRRIVLLKEAVAIAASDERDAILSPQDRPSAGGRRASTADQPVAESLARSATHSPRFDLADPYRRGPDAGEVAVAEIERALDVFLPWYAARSSGETKSLPVD